MIKNQKNPYGDGKSAKRIVNELIKMYNTENLISKTLTY